MCPPVLAESRVLRGSLRVRVGDSWRVKRGALERRALSLITHWGPTLGPTLGTGSSENKILINGNELYSY